jgi:hypothetical protein
MRHQWQDRSEENGILGPPKRCCRNCGAEQERVTHYQWMRVTGYRWLPLVGRCKAKEMSA